MKWLTPLALTTTTIEIHAILELNIWFGSRLIASVTSVHLCVPTHQFQLHWASHLTKYSWWRLKKSLTVEARLWLPFSRCPFLSLWSVEVESRMSHILSPIRLSLLVWEYFTGICIKPRARQDSIFSWNSPDLIFSSLSEIETRFRYQVTGTNWIKFV